MGGGGGKMGFDGVLSSSQVDDMEMISLQGADEESGEG